MRVEREAQKEREKVGEKSVDIKFTFNILRSSLWLKGGYTGKEA